MLSLGGQLKTVNISLYVSLIIWTFLFRPSFAETISSNEIASNHAEQIAHQLIAFNSVSINLSQENGIFYNMIATREVKNCIDKLHTEFHLNADESYKNLLLQQLEAVTDRSNQSVHDVFQRMLSLDDLILISAYTGNYYQPVNSTLWKKKNINKIECFVRDLRKSLKKFPNYIGEVYRGTNLPKNILKEHRPGNIVVYNAFTSASIGGISEIFRDQPVWIKIHSLHAKDISDFNEDEGEVIFNPGTQFKVLTRKEATDLDPIIIELQELE